MSYQVAVDAQPSRLADMSHRPTMEAVEANGEVSQSLQQPRPVQSFADFLRPLEPSDFLTRIYGREPLYIPGHPERFFYLMPWDVLNTIVLQQRLPTPRLRLTKSGKAVETSKYLSEANGRCDIAALAEQFRD